MVDISYLTLSFYIYKIKMSDISRFSYLSICENGTGFHDGTGLPAIVLS
jgi:hypothetical protein